MLRARFRSLIHQRICILEWIIEQAKRVLELKHPDDGFIDQGDIKLSFLDQSSAVV
ncbi:hypothetical protein D3C76_696750 [compost metagenome]